MKRKTKPRTILYVVVANGRPVLTDGWNLVAYGYRTAAVMATNQRNQVVRRAEIKLLRG